MPSSRSVAPEPDPVEENVETTSPSSSQPQAQKVGFSEIRSEPSDQLLVRHRQVRVRTSSDDSIGLPRGLHEPIKEYVSISFQLDELAGGETHPSAEHHDHHATSSQSNGVKRRSSKGTTINASDLLVRRHLCFCSTIGSKIENGATDRDMEEKFAASKYKHFRGAFTQVSLMMSIGMFSAGVVALMKEDWYRAIVLFLVVAPIYLGYGVWCLRYPDSYLTASNTRTEQILITVLSLQSVALVVSEFLRPRPDYGYISMHIGFVHNFTPLGELAIHGVAAGATAVPYIFVKLLVFWAPKFPRAFGPKAVVSDDYEYPEISSGSGENCSTTEGDARILLDLLVPFVVLLYQGVATFRRDMSMRLDALSSEQLRTQRNELALETQKCENLLLSMLPRKIIGKLKANEKIEPQPFAEVTVIFAEICRFGHLCKELPPKDVVRVLNTVYQEFDRLTTLLHVYKVETVGQVYMAVVGCPEPIANHADVAVHFALAAQESIKQMKEQGILKNVLRGFDLKVRVGCNSGRIRAGVVGLDTPRYKLFGDTVNTASRMESTCEHGAVQVSPSTKERLQDGLFDLEDRGEIPIKGKGQMRTTFVRGYADCQRPDKFLIERLDKDSSKEEEGGRNSQVSQFSAGQRPSLTQELEVMGINSDSPSAVRMRQERGLSQNSTSAAAQHNMLVGLLSHSLGTKSQTWERGASVRTTASRKQGGQGCSCSYSKLARVFLLVAPDQKRDEWMEVLRQDKPTFWQLSLEKRISFARNLTITWLLILALVAALDYFLDVVEHQTEDYRASILLRALGNQLVGLVYLLLLTKPEFFLKFAEPLTVGMLFLQGIGVLSRSFLVFNNEVATVVIYGAYVLFYSVCDIKWRLGICFVAVLGYVIVQATRCGSEGLEGGVYNILFLVIFFSFMACGVMLGEHLEHVAHFEQRRVAKRVSEIGNAKAAGSKLLLTLLPAHVVDLVNDGVSPIAEYHSSVTIIFTDIKGYTAFSSKLKPLELVDFLNSMYSAFDEIIANWGLHKVEIIGDAYFIAAGCPEKDGKSPSEYAMRAVEVALALQRILAVVVDDPTVSMRVGLHTGDVVAGVVGKKGPRYHLFGTAVGYAEKMESHGTPGRVQISDATYNELQQGGFQYQFEERLIDVEGETDKQRTWMVLGGNNEAANKIRMDLARQRASVRMKSNPSNEDLDPAGASCTMPTPTGFPSESEEIEGNSSTKSTPKKRQYSVSRALAESLGMG